MLQNIKKILLLGKKKDVILLQLLIIFSSILELTSLISIIPFLGLITNDNFISQNEYMLYFFNYLNFENTENFIIFFGFITLFFFISSTFIILFTRFKLIQFNEKFAVILNNYFYKNFLKRDSYFFFNNSSNYIMRTLNDDTFRVVNGVIKPTLNLVARGLLASLVIFSLLIYNYQVTIILFLILLITYFIIFNKFKSKIKTYGDNLAKFQTIKIKTISETFASIKDIVILDKFFFFETYFNKIIKEISKAHIFVSFINISPRYIIDGIGFSFIILLILFFKTYVKTDLTYLLTSVSFMVFAAYKLIPAFQEIYSSLVLLKNNKVALDNLINLMVSADKNLKSLPKNYKNSFNKSLEIKNLNFNYKKNDKNKIFNQTSIKILKGKKHLIIGKSGSGKSTLVEILLGFLNTQNYQLMIDNKIVDSNFTLNLRSKFSYLSQAPFMLDETIKNNICFGEKKVNKKLLSKSLELSCSKDFILDFKNGIETKVGENGVKLSGGQRQRINLARSFYQNRDFMILDEATNELDTNTEEKVLSNLISQKNKTIIIISHNKNISDKFDLIYKINNKKIYKL